MAWPLEPLHVRERLRRPWWLPLLIPGFVSLIVVIDAFAANTHAVHHRNPAASIIGWIAVLFLIAVPSFFAGIRFIREALDDPRRHRT